MFSMCRLRAVHSVKQCVGFVPCPYPQLFVSPCQIRFTRVCVAEPDQCYRSRDVTRNAVFAVCLSIYDIISKILRFRHSSEVT